MHLSRIVKGTDLRRVVLPQLQLQWRKPLPFHSSRRTKPRSEGVGTRIVGRLLVNHDPKPYLISVDFLVPRATASANPKLHHNAWSFSTSRGGRRAQL